MDTDGPGSTESPYTVDAGHFQVEMTLVSYLYDGIVRRRDAAIRGVGHRTQNLKIGLLNQLDVQLLLEPYNVHYESEDGTRVTRRGYGDTTVRVKYNFLGQRWRAHGVRRDALCQVSHRPGRHRQPRGRGRRRPAAGGRTPRAFYLGAPRDSTRCGTKKNPVTTPSHQQHRVRHDLFGSLFGYVEVLQRGEHGAELELGGYVRHGTDLPVDGERPVEPRTGHRGVTRSGGRLDCVRRDCVAVLALNSIRAGFPPALPGAAQIDVCSANRF